MADKNQNFKETFAKRLKAARVMRGLTIDQLSKLTGGEVSKPNISKYESAKMMPSAAAHIALAKALELDFDYFFRPITAELSEVNYQGQEKIKEKEMRTIAEKIRDIAERSEELDRTIADAKTFKNPVENITVSGEDDVPKVAEKMRKEWHLGCGVLLNVVDTLEVNGVKVVKIEGPEYFESANTMVNDVEPLIVINPLRTLEIIRFSAMRELGYIVMRLSPSLGAEDADYLSCIFACEMLLPSNMLKQMVPPHVGSEHIELLRSIQTQWGIPVDKMWERLNMLGIVNDTEYTKYCRRMNNDKSFRDYVNESTYNGDERAYNMERKLMRAVDNEIITREKVDETFKVLVTNLAKETKEND